MKIRKISKYIHMLLAGSAVALGMTGCSDNEYAGLRPSEVARYLRVDDNDHSFSIDLKASPSTFDVAVQSNTIWKVVEKSEGGWVTVDKLSGRADESFAISVLENMKEEARNGSVTVFMVDKDGNTLPDESIEITLKQENSNVRLQPSSVPPFAANSDDPTQKFEIISNVDWTMTVTYESADMERFVTVYPEEGADMTAHDDGSYSGSSNAAFSIRVAENRQDANRKAFINLHSDISTYQVEITQNKANYNFTVDPTEDRVIGAEGDDITFTVISLSEDGWRVESASKWITFSSAGENVGSFAPKQTVATIAPNESGKERAGKIIFRPNDTKYEPLEINVTQMGYYTTFTASRADAQGYVSENGGTLRYDLDTSFDWEVKVPEWIKVSPASGNRSDNRQQIILTVDPNHTNKVRTDTMTITPKATVFPGGVTIKPSVFGIGPLKYQVSQLCYDAVFSLSRVDSEGIVTENGATLRFELNSSFDWKISVPSWMSADKTNGTASSAPQTITVTVAANRTNESRPGELTVTPQPTSSQGGVTFDPKNYGCVALRWSVTQFGGREPAVSVPWLRDGYGLREATVEFNYYSPFRTIASAGLQWRKESDESWQTLTATVSDGTEGTVSFDLTGLSPATKYVARGYVVDSDGNEKYGSATHPFTTPGQYPSGEDNPVP